MKSCPACNRTFEDTFTFCLADGSLLNAPFDPQATNPFPPQRDTEPPPTELMNPAEFIPPTQPAIGAMGLRPEIGARMPPHVDVRPGYPAPEPYAYQEQARGLRWAELLGVGHNRWRRMLVFFVALSIADIFWLVVSPTITTQPGGETAWEFFNIPDAWQWTEYLLGNLLLALLASVIFGAIRNFLAIPLLALVYSLLLTVLSFLIFKVQLLGLTMSSEHDFPFWDSYRFLTMVRIFLWTIAFFGVVEIAVRVIRNLLVALLVAATIISLLMVPVAVVLSNLFLETGMSWNTRLAFLPFNIVSSLLTALVFWLGLRLTPRAVPHPALNRQGP